VSKMKKIVLIAVATFVVLAALGAAGYAYAQTPTPPTNPLGPGSAYGRGGGMMGGFRGGMMGGWGSAQAYGPMHEYMTTAMAEALGMTVEQLNAELAAGKTMWLVAQEKGFTLEQFQSLMLEARQKALAQMVADGVITQAQADWMLSRMQGMWGSAGGAGCPGMGGGFGRGGFGRGGGRWNTPPAQPTPSNNG
jgi:hypothetical protein